LTDQPLHTLLQALSTLSGTCLNRPSPISDIIKVQIFCDVISWESVEEILLIREDEERNIDEFIFLKQLVQFGSGFF
jgi:hypothetical protein